MNSIHKQEDTQPVIGSRWLDAQLRKQIQDRVGSCVDFVGADGKMVLHDFFYTNSPESFARELLERSTYQAELGVPLSLCQLVPILDDQNQVQYLEVYPITDAYDAGLISDEDIDRTIGRIFLIQARRAFDRVHKKPSAVQSFEEKAFLTANRTIGKLFPRSMMYSWVTRLVKNDLKQRGILKDGQKKNSVKIPEHSDIEEVFGDLSDYSPREASKEIPSMYRVYPDHLSHSGQASLAWGMSNQVFSRSEIAQIHFDHGETADVYLQERSGMIDSHWESMRSEFIDGYKTK